MRISLLSDLHVEFDRDGGDALLKTIDPDFPDVFVLAGDIGMHMMAMDFMGKLCVKLYPKPVIYVHGNHEYYRSHREEVLAMTRRLEVEQDNLTFLDKEAITINGQRFVGATGWYADVGSYNWSDFRHIAGLKDWVHQEFLDTQAFFERELREGDVMVTHMNPSVELVPDRWQGNPNNVFFVNDMTNLIKERRPLLALFGHTHDKIDKMLGVTWCLTNPRGYPFEAAETRFNPTFVVEAK